MAEIYKINTDLFGEIEVSQTDGLTEDYEIVLGGKNMTINLQIFENIVSDNTLKTVENMLNQIPQMYEKGKNAILDGIDSDDTIKSFIDFYLDAADDYYEIFDVDSSDEITSAMIAEKLEPRNIFIATTKDNMIDCNFDFSLPEEYTDQLLVIRFDDNYEIYDISEES